MLLTTLLIFHELGGLFRFLFFESVYNGLIVKAVLVTIVGKATEFKIRTIVKVYPYLQILIKLVEVCITMLLLLVAVLLQLMAAIAAGEKGLKVLLIDKGDKLGRKLANFLAADAVMSPIASLLKKSLNTYLVTVSFYIAPFQFSVMKILLRFLKS